MVAVVGDKVAFGRDQVVSSTQVSKKFNEVRKLAKEGPLFVSDRNAGFDTVILSYDDFEEMAVELEHARQALLYSEAAQRILKADSAESHDAISLEDTLGQKAYAAFLEIDPNAESDESIFE